MGQFTLMAWDDFITLNRNLLAENLGDIFFTLAKLLGNLSLLILFFLIFVAVAIFYIHPKVRRYLKQPPSNDKANKASD